MPITIDQNLINAAIIEFHTARDHGKSDPPAWAAAVARVRHDVLTIAAMTCERVADRLACPSGNEADAAHACSRAIRDLY